MNYLAHYYIDSEENRPYHNLGLILPDLLGIYSRKFKLSLEAGHYVDSELTREIFSGILKHFELDAIFHQSEFFLKHTTLIRYSLDENEVNFLATKQHFLAHILLELVIDKVFIANDFTLVERFYTDLDQIDASELLFFMKNKNDDFINGFLEFFRRFRTRRYLYGYTSVDAVIFLLNKVLERISLTAINDEADLLKLRKCIEHTEINIINDLKALSTIRDNELI